LVYATDYAIILNTVAAMRMKIAYWKNPCVVLCGMNNSLEKSLFSKSTPVFT
jgi:hypothetical protein